MKSNPGLFITIITWLLVILPLSQTLGNTLNAVNQIRGISQGLHLLSPKVPGSNLHEELKSLGFDKLNQKALALNSSLQEQKFNPSNFFVRTKAIELTVWTMELIEYPPISDALADIDPPNWLQKLKTIIDMIDFLHTEIYQFQYEQNHEELRVQLDFIVQFVLDHIISLYRLGNQPTHIISELRLHLSKCLINWSPIAPSDEFKAELQVAYQIWNSKEFQNYISGEIFSQNAKEIYLKQKLNDVLNHLFDQVLK